MALRELDWHRLWWVSSGGCLTMEEVSRIWCFSYIFPACHEFASSKDADSSLTPQGAEFGHLTNPDLILDGTRGHADTGVECWVVPWSPLLQCSAGHLSPLLAWPALRSWKFQLPEIALTSQTTPVFFINESKSHLCLLVLLQVSTAMLQFWSDFFFFFLWKLNEKCKMFLI